MKTLLLSALLWVSSAAAVQLNENNTMFLLGGINFQTSFVFQMQYASVRSAVDGDLYVVIHSPGGEIGAMEGILEVIKKDKKTHAVIIWAASAAAAISQSVRGHTYIVPKGQLMFHQVAIITGAPISQNDAARMFNELNRLNTKFAKVCNRKMQLPDYKKRTERDWFLNADEAVKLKAAVLAPLECSETLRDAEITVPVFDFLTGVPRQKNFCDLLN